MQHEPDAQVADIGGAVAQIGIIRVAAGISANPRDGVLQVHIPKHAEARPRRIEVRVD